MSYRWVNRLWCQATNHVWLTTGIGESVRYRGTVSIHVRTLVEQECARCGQARRVWRTRREWGAPQ